MRSNFYILISALFLTSCSTVTDSLDSFTSFFSSEKVLFLSAYENVKVVDQDSNLSGKNIHPINISDERIEGALKLLLFRVGKKTSSLFPGDKIKIISDSISEGLSIANSSEDVIFTAESWYSDLPGTRLKDNRVVSGRVFYNKDGLNVIFGSVLRKGFQSTTDPMLQSRNPDLKKNPYMPGSRLVSVKNPFALAVPPNSGIQRPRVARGRVDWIILTNKSLIPRTNISENQRKLARSSNIEVQGLKNEVEQLRQELRSLRNPNQRYQYPPQGNVYNRQTNVQPYGYQYPNRYPAPYPYPYPYPQPYQNPNQQAYPNPNYQVNQNQGQQSRELSLKSLENMRSRGLISEESYLIKLKELGY